MAILLLICYPPSSKGGFFIYISVHYKYSQKKHNASYNFISQKVLKATLCSSFANIHIYFDKVKYLLIFLRSCAWNVKLHVKESIFHSIRLITNYLWAREGVKDSAENLFLRYRNCITVWRSASWGCHAVLRQRVTQCFVRMSCSASSEGHEVLRQGGKKRKEYAPSPSLAG